MYTERFNRTHATTVLTGWCGGMGQERKDENRITIQILGTQNVIIIDRKRTKCFAENNK